MREAVTRSKVALERACLFAARCGSRLLREPGARKRNLPLAIPRSPASEQVQWLRFQPVARVSPRVVLPGEPLAAA
jgi:hypothetical protein